MKQAVYDLTEQQHVIFQLRILKPAVSVKILEVLYYIWKYPETYDKELVRNGKYKNIPTVNITLINMVDMGLLEQDLTRKRKKILIPEISSRIFNEDVSYTIKLKK
jgi:hypothetical protein